MQIILDLVRTTNISFILKLYFFFFLFRLTFIFLDLGVFPLTLHHWNQKLLRKSREILYFKHLQGRLQSNKWLETQMENYYYHVFQLFFPASAVGTETDAEKSVSCPGGGLCSLGGQCPLSPLLGFYWKASIKHLVNEL